MATGGTAAITAMSRQEQEYQTQQLASPSGRRRSTAQASVYASLSKSTDIEETDHKDTPPEDLQRHVRVMGQI